MENPLTKKRRSSKSVDHMLTKFVETPLTPRNHIFSHMKLALVSGLLVSAKQNKSVDISCHLKTKKNKKTRTPFEFFTVGLIKIRGSKDDIDRVWPSKGVVLFVDSSYRMRENTIMAIHIWLIFFGFCLFFLSFVFVRKKNKTRKNRKDKRNGGTGWTKSIS